MRVIIWFVMGAITTALLAAVAHSGLGTGAAFVDDLESRARIALGEAGGATANLVMVRAPALERAALISGDADAGRRRELLDAVRAVPGMRDVRWDEGGSASGQLAPDARGTPLLLESLLPLLPLYGVGFGIGWLLWGRRSD